MHKRENGGPGMHQWLKYQKVKFDSDLGAQMTNIYDNVQDALIVFTFSLALYGSVPLICDIDAIARDCLPGEVQIPVVAYL